MTKITSSKKFYFTFSLVNLFFLFFAVQLPDIVKHNTIYNFRSFNETIIPIMSIFGIFFTSAFMVTKKEIAFRGVQVGMITLALLFLVHGIIYLNGGFFEAISAPAFFLISFIAAMLIWLMNKYKKADIERSFN